MYWIENGDCLELMKKIPSSSIDMILFGSRMKSQKTSGMFLHGRTKISGERNEK